MSDIRDQFGKAGACLHCLVWDVINTHSPTWPDDASKKMYDHQEIIGNLVDVMAQCIAALPDRNERRQYMKLADDRLREQVRNNLESGNHPLAREVKVQ